MLFYAAANFCYYPHADMPMGMDMRTKLEAIQAAKGLENQTELAAVFHVGQSTISRWMNGKMVPDKHLNQIDSVYKELFEPLTGAIQLPDRLMEKFNRLSPEDQRRVLVMFEAGMDMLAK
jgi:transcriptional regulator with XRE-family HTH domain